VSKTTAVSEARRGVFIKHLRKMARSADPGDIKATFTRLLASRPVSAIATDFGVSSPTVRYHASQMDLGEVPRARGQVLFSDAITKSQWSSPEEFFVRNAFLTHQEMARMLGMSASAISRHHQLFLMSLKKSPSKGRTGSGRKSRSR